VNREMLNHMSTGHSIKAVVPLVPSASQPLGMK